MLFHVEDPIAATNGRITGVTAPDNMPRGWNHLANMYARYLVVGLRWVLQLEIIHQSGTRDSVGARPDIVHTIDDVYRVYHETFNTNNPDRDYHTKLGGDTNDFYSQARKDVDELGVKYKLLRAPTENVRDRSQKMILKGSHKSASMLRRDSPDNGSDLDTHQHTMYQSFSAKTRRDISTADVTENRADAQVNLVVTLAKDSAYARDLNDDDVTFHHNVRWTMNWYWDIIMFQPENPDAQTLLTQA